MQRALDFRAALLASESCSYSADVTADFGARVYQFSLSCTYHSQENNAALTVTAPETIAGIQAEIDGETAAVTFEDVALELGTMAGGHVAPMQLPQIIGEAWTYGYLETLSEVENGYLVTARTGYDEEELLIYTYYDLQMSPTRAEVFYDGDCVLSAAIENFSIT